MRGYEHKILKVQILRSECGVANKLLRDGLAFLDLLRERLHAPDRQINSTVNHASGDEGRYNDDDGSMTTMMNWLRISDDVLRRLWKQVSELVGSEGLWHEHK